MTCRVDSYSRHRPHMAPGSHALFLRSAGSAVYLAASAKKI